MYGNYVDFVTNSDSLPCEFENVRTHYSTPSKYTPEGEALGNGRNKKRNAFVIEVIRSAAFDIIINNDENNGSMREWLTKNAIVPCIHFVHSCVDIAGGPGLIGHIDGYGRFAAAGHTTVCMSKNSLAGWIAQVDKSRKYLESDRPAEEYFTTFFHPGIMWEKPEISFCGSSPVMVGRINPSKRYHEALKVTDNICIYAQTPKTDLERNYAKELEKYNPVILYDWDYDKIMQHVRGTQALIICGPESFGLTAFEAHSFGNPVICLSKKPHASQEILGGDAFIQLKDHKELAEFWKTWKPNSIETRQSIIDSMWNYWNPSERHKHLQYLFGVAIHRFANRQIPETNSIERFF
jgi:glycosyltransferase involved in cell wall biosynthesis